MKFDKKTLALIGQKLTEGIADAIKRGFAVDPDPYKIVTYKKGRIVCGVELESMGEFPTCKIRAFINTTVAGGLSMRAMVGAGEVVNITISDIKGDLFTLLDIDNLCEEIGDDLERKFARDELLFFMG